LRHGAIHRVMRGRRQRQQGQKAKGERMAAHGYLPDFQAPCLPLRGRDASRARLDRRDRPSISCV
jgi:hypothetical protein